MKISIITICFNNKKDIIYTIESVIKQTYNNIEYIIVDGASTDGSVDIIRTYKNYISKFISEPDNGIYDAINKGIKAASGDVIGLIHAGDELYDNSVIEKIADSFKCFNIEAIYGHSVAYTAKREKLVRVTHSPEYHDTLFKLGWHPPHQTLYIKRHLFEKLGYYKLKFKIASDYELMLRYIYFNNIRIKLLDYYIMKFHTGGVSSKSILNGLKHSIECANCWKDNGQNIPWYTLPMKMLRRLKRNYNAIINRSDGNRKI